MKPDSLVYYYIYLYILVMVLYIPCVLLHIFIYILVMVYIISIHICKYMYLITNVRKPISAILYPKRIIYYLAPEIKFIWRPHLLYGARNLNYLAPPLIISRPHLLSRAPTYYLAPPLIISRPHILYGAPLISIVSIQFRARDNKWGREIISGGAR